MLIRLEYNGRIIHEISSSALSGEIVIGRSHSCTWPVPKEDPMCSSKHAALFLKGRSVWLKDLESTNGTFHNGKRIIKKKLAVGDKISVGNCVLCAEPDRGGDSKVFSELQVLTGKTRGQKKQLAPPVFTIGSDPAANLVFLDLLVSRRHAEILVKEDASCWIRDLGSKNGTQVNGMPLRDDKERLLKDGDRIAVSQFELEFHDGAVKRSNKQAWLRIGILAATLIAGLSAYSAYQRARPSSEAFIRQARKLAAAEAFAEASAAVERAATARRAEANQVTIEELRRLLGIWQNTRTVWARAKEALGKGNWTQVSRDLGMLQSSKKDAWEWNEKAAEEKATMSAAKAMLDAYLRAESSIAREELDLESLSADHAAVKESLAQLAKEAPAYLVPLRDELNAISVRQAALLEESKKLEQALDGLSSDNPTFGPIVRAIAQALESKEGSLKRRAQSLEPSVKALAESYALLATASQNARELELDKAMALDIRLPSADTCAIDPRVSLARQMLERIHANLRIKAGQMTVLLAEIEKRTGPGSGEPECLLALTDPDAFAKMMACDALRQPLPKRSRKEPASAYDKLLGVEEFYTHLSAFPEPADPAMVSDLPFTSSLTQLREAAQKIETFLSFIRQPDNQWLLGKRTSAQVKRFEALLGRRDALVAELVAKAESDAGRTGLLAGGIAARLTTQPGQVTIKALRPEEWVAAELKRQRSAIIKLNEEYSLAAPARQIEIRNAILNAGLPGDPVVRRMWAFRDAAGAPSPAP